MASKQDIKKNKNSYLWFRGDCIELLQGTPDEHVQLIVTSPPYNIGKSYEKTQGLSQYLTFQSRVISECARVLHRSGSICWQVGNYVNNGEIVPLDILFYDLFRHKGFKLRNRIIWAYDHGLHSTHRFSGRYETILWFTKSDDYYFELDSIRIPQLWPNKKHFKGPKKGQLSGNPLGKNPSDVWTITQVKNNHPEKIKGGHPCQFPIELVQRCIRSMTRPGEIVLDPFGGVATTIIAAIKNTRIGMGAEIDREYHKIGQKRISEAIGKKHESPKVNQRPNISVSF